MYLEFVINSFSHSHGKLRTRSLRSAQNSPQPPPQPPKVAAHPLSAPAPGAPMALVRHAGISAQQLRQAGGGSRLAVCRRWEDRRVGVCEFGGGACVHELDVFPAKSGKTHSRAFRFTSQFQLTCFHPRAGKHTPELPTCEHVHIH